MSLSAYLFFLVPDAALAFSGIDMVAVCMASLSDQVVPVANTS